MTQNEKLLFLINYLIKDGNHSGIKIPETNSDRKQLLRSLMNIRPAYEISDEFITIQNEYLRREIAEKGITDCNTLPFLCDKISLWQGDITTLRCGAIVNAANNKLLGCFIPCHKCIDNAIHTYAGVQLRAECDKIIKSQKHDEPIGNAKITNAYNLPCDYVIHTVGPAVYGALTQKDCDLLYSCYLSCLQSAEKNNIKSIAFCCISTGEFHFPNDKAAQTAINAVTEYLKNSSIERVIFNVFKDSDKEIYENLLKKFV